MTIRSRTARLAPDLLAALVLAAGALFLHRDGLFGGPAFYERDTELFYFPLAAWVSEQLKAGAFPLWLPGMFTGYPIFADGELGLAYLPQLALLALLPADLALVWGRALHTFLAGVFAYLFLRDLRLGPLAGLGGALVFAFGSFFTTQMHHENIVRSAVWLPLVLLLADRALKARTRRGWGWLGLSALAFAQSALGLHVQPVLMIALALGAWVLFRLLAGWPRPGLSASAEERSSPPGLRWGVLVGAGSVGGGLALAAVQWGPLLEWARVSTRRGGVDYAFASAFPLPPRNLPTLLFPYFFRQADASTWWSLWLQWETLLYVGIPTLALALVGVVWSRRREAWFFLPLALLSLLIGMAQAAPLLNLHALLWSVPGFSFLRAPGRFSYLVVFGAAGLTGLGLQALIDRRAPLQRLGLAAVGALPPVVLLAALLALLPGWRAWLAADPERGLAYVREVYLSARAQYAIGPEGPYQGLLFSLDLANPKTGWSLLLLGLTALAFVAWLGLGRRRAPLGQGLFVVLLATDLLVFAVDFHPKASLASLRPPAFPTVPAGARVAVRATSQDLPELEPNLLLSAGFAQTDGYSSLPSQRQVELQAATAQQPNLLDLWAAPYVVEPVQPADAREAGGVRFRTGFPLVGGYAAGGGLAFRLPTDVPLRAIRVVGTLSEAVDVPQGAEVARLVVTLPGGPTVPIRSLRAGVDLAERAIERPSLQGLVRHAEPPGPTALDLPESSPLGEEYQAHLYLAEVPFSNGPVTLSAGSNAESAPLLTIVPTQPKALLQVYGLGLVEDGTGAVRSLGLADRQGMRVAYEDARLRVLEDSAAFPRALVVRAGAAVDRWSQPDQTPIAILSGPTFDPRGQLLLEGLPAPPEDPRPTGGLEQPASSAVLEAPGPNGLRIRTSAPAAGYLLVNDFYHRGWTARVDGQPAPVLIANGLFRAVPLPSGEHVVELRFEPLSQVLGAAVSLLSLLALIALLVWAFRVPARAPGRAGA